MRTKLPPVVVHAEEVWTNAVRNKNSVLVFAHGFALPGGKEVADLLAGAGITSTFKENVVRFGRKYSPICTASIQREFWPGKDVSIADLAPKVRAALIKHAGEND